MWKGCGGMDNKNKPIEQEQKQKKRYTIGMRKAKSFPHFITLYKKDWENEQAWESLLHELELPEDTPKVSLLLSKGSAI